MILVWGFAVVLGISYKICNVCGYRTVLNIFMWIIDTSSYGCFICIGTIILLSWFPHSSKNMGKIGWYLTTTKHSKGRTVPIILGMYCSYTGYSIYSKISNISCTKSKNLNNFRLVLQLSLPSQLKMLSREWRCSWSSTDRRSCRYMWLIDNFVAY